MIEDQDIFNLDHWGLNTTDSWAVRGCLHGPTAGWRPSGRYHVSTMADLGEPDCVQVVYARYILGICIPLCKLYLWAHPLGSVGAAVVKETGRDSMVPVVASAIEFLVQAGAYLVLVGED